MSRDVAGISVSVIPDTSKFQRLLKDRLRYWERYYRNHPVEVRVSPRLDEQAFMKVKRRLQLLDPQNVTVKTELDDAGLRQAARKAKNAIGDTDFKVKPVLDDRATQKVKQDFDRGFNDLTKPRDMTVHIKGVDKIKERLDDIRDQIVEIKTKVDKADLARAKKQIDDAAKDRTARINVRVDDKATKRQLKNLEKAVERARLNLPLHPELEQLDQFEKLKKDVQKRLGFETLLVRPDMPDREFKQFYDRVRKLSGENQIPIPVNWVVRHEDLQKRLGSFDVDVNPRMQVRELQKQLDGGETIWANVGAMWKPGTFDPLKDQFFAKFPDLKPWVWPQLDTAHLADLAKQAQDKVNRFKVRYNMYAELAWAKGAPGEAAGLVAKIKAHMRPLTMLVKADLDKSSSVKNIARAISMINKDAKVVVRPVLDKSSYAKVTTVLRSLARHPLRSVLDVKAKVDSSSMATARAQMAKIAAIALKGAKYRVDVAVRGAAEVYSLYARLGVRKVFRWKLQVEYKEAQRAFGFLKSTTGTTMKLGSVFSGLSMMITGVLGAVGSLGQALVDMAPAAWPAVGVLASFATGAGVAAIALKDYKKHLGSLKGPLDEVKSGISDAFWGEARIPILENAQKLIRELSPALTELGSVMGGVFAHFATAMGNSSGEIQNIIANSSVGFEILGPAVERATEAVMKLVSAGSSFFPQFAGWLNELSVSFSNWVSEIEASEGGLEGWMQGGLDTAFTLGSILMNLVGIIWDVSKAAAGAGGGLDEFNNRLEKIREILQSPEVQAGLGEFFAGVKEGSGAVLGSIGGLIQGLAASGTEAGNLVTQFGELGAAIIDGLGQAVLNPAFLNGISSMADGFTDVAEALKPVVYDMGAKLAPMFTQIGDILSANAPAIGEFAQNLVDLGAISLNNVVDLAEMILPSLLDVMNQVLPLVTDFAEMLLPAILDTVGMLLPILQPLVETVLTTLIEAMIQLLPPIMELVDAILPILMEILQALIPVFVELVEGGVVILQAAIEFLTPILETVVGILRDVLTPVLGFVADGFKLIGEAIDILSPILVALGELFSVTMDAIWTVVETVLGQIKVIWDLVWGQVKDFAELVWSAIGSVISTQMDTIAAVIDTIMSLIKGDWSGVWDNIKRIAENVWKLIKDVVKIGIEAVKSTISNVLKAIKGTWENIWNGIKSFASNIWDGITSIWSGGVSTIKGIFERMGNAIKAPFESAFNAIKRLWNNTIGRISFKVPSWVPGIGGKGWSAPKLAEGGIITSPTLAWVGEAGDSEAVIPLPKIKPLLAEALVAAGGGAPGGGDTTIYNVTMEVQGLTEVQTLTKFINTLNVQTRMKVGARA